jgi:hypothetical protein
VSEFVFFNVWQTTSPKEQQALVDAMRSEAPALAAKAGFLSLTAWMGQAGDYRVIVEGCWQSREAGKPCATRAARPSLTWDVRAKPPHSPAVWQHLRGPGVQAWWMIAAASCSSRPQESPRAGHERALRVLEQSHADVLLWGWHAAPKARRLRRRVVFALDRARHSSENPRVTPAARRYRAAAVVLG